MNTTHSIVQWLISVSLLNLGVSLLVAFFRLVKGPSMPDRVVALDLIGILVAAFIAAYCMSVEQDVYLDVAITITLLAFVSTVAFARYVQKVGQERSPERGIGKT